jgi:catechol 2,3-dioxygenase
MKVHSIGHVVLKVRDLARSVPFYTKVLGMKEVARNDRGMAFLIFKDNHHDIALIETGGGSPDAPKAAPGLAHLALKIGSTLEELREAKGWLESNGIEIARIRDHAVTKSIYFPDPDGNEIEVFVESDPRVWQEDPKLVSTGVPMPL